ncbi:MULTISPECIES: DUF1868 domain-containing protein [unclassified Neorhizobium]|uniref:DUF1868 domain-containing protein n=1 Tax=unclassified Neorhizobium TaxID=2629175 RepID=UPI001FF4A914|nr:MULTISPECIES: DUF1868 domain-containing protein [unclassified Neorhizobium]MCJ9672161.1 DUF1868 domain-containing protein [Neorhizobium sp. SHOUNA12B]MCJ9748038.1 DUF1868 domain-containing protein [Neorhizobium sp. SHOUNA12A]
MDDDRGQQLLRVIKVLTGEGSGLDRPKLVSDGKLKAGSFLPFYGNKFLLRLLRNETVHAAFEAMRDELKDALKIAKLEDFFLFPDRDSLHMTVQDGLCSSDINKHPRARRALFDLGLRRFGGANKYLVRPAGIVMGESLSVLIEPDNHEERLKLWGMRSACDEVLGMEHSATIDCQFHVDLAYPTHYLTDEQARFVAARVRKAYDTHIARWVKFELGLVEFCEFDKLSEVVTAGTLGLYGYVDIYPKMEEKLQSFK